MKLSLNKSYQELFDSVKEVRSSLESFIKEVDNSIKELIEACIEACIKLCCCRFTLTIHQDHALSCAAPT